MRTVEQTRQRVLVAWNRQWTSWLGGAGEWPKAFPLDSPTQKTAQGNWNAYNRWVKSWFDELRGNAMLSGELLSVDKAWSTMGKQEVPTHVSFANPHQLASFLGPSYADLYLRTEARWRECAKNWPDLLSTLRTQAEWMAGLSTTDYQRCVAVVDWLSVNLDRGMYLRQLPISGLDTKWIERHAGPIREAAGSALWSHRQLARDRRTGSRSPAPTHPPTR